MNNKVLVCELCNAKFSEEDVEKLNFFPEQRICYSCYAEGKKQPHRVWCFGKLSVRDAAGKIKQGYYGYEPEGSNDCKKYCPDRKVCHLFATNRITALRTLARTQSPFRSGTLSAMAFVTCVLGTTRQKLRQLVESYGGDITITLRKLRSQKFGNQKWKFIEDDEKIKIRM